MTQRNNTENYLKQLHLGGIMSAAPVGYKSLLSDETRQAAKALRLALEPFLAENPNIPASYIVTFLTVAEKEGRPVSEYANEVGLFKAVMTRHLLDLGERNRHGDEGMNIIEQRRDRQDLRINRSFVNEKGAALLSKVRRAWEVSRKG